MKNFTETEQFSQKRILKDNQMRLGLNVFENFI